MTDLLLLALALLRPDGTPCNPDEPGELVHRGSLVALGYWNDINLPNLIENVLPTKHRATLILQKGADHSVERVRLRKL